MDMEINQIFDRMLDLQSKTVEVQTTLSTSIKSLNDNTKALNDSFVLHCQSTSELEKEIKIIRNELMRYLKITIIVIMVILSGLAGIKGLPELLKTFGV